MDVAWRWLSSARRDAEIRERHTDVMESRRTHREYKYPHHLSTMGTHIITSLHEMLVGHLGVLCLKGSVVNIP